MKHYRRHLLYDQQNENPPPGDPAPPPQDPPANPPPADPPPAQSVSAEEHNKLLAKLKQAESDRDTHKANLKGKELEQMKGQERWKEIAEMNEAEAKEARLENETLKKGIVSKDRMNAIRTAALQAGIRKDALDDLENFDFPEVQVETTSLGNVNIVGAQTAVAALKLKKPYLFGTKSSSLNGSLPEVVEGGTISLDQIMKAEEKARKSGSADDRAAYAKISQLYNQQRRGS